MRIDVNFVSTKTMYSTFQASIHNRIAYLNSIGNFHFLDSNESVKGL